METIIEFFTTPYCWFYIVMNYLTGRYFEEGRSYSEVSSSCLVMSRTSYPLLMIFLFLGFFFMEHWWYPIALFAVQVVIYAIPIPKKLLMLLWFPMFFGLIALYYLLYGWWGLLCIPVMLYCYFSAIRNMHRPADNS